MGHLLIAECARDQFDLDKVLFVTSPRPPHRRTDLLDAEDRHSLVSAAVADNPYFEASRIELDRQGPSYTSETIRSLAKLLTLSAQSPNMEQRPLSPSSSTRQTRHEGVRLNLILGADNIAQISQWHDAAYLLDTCRFLVAPRLIDLTQTTNKLPKQVQLNAVPTKATTEPAQDDEDSDREPNLQADMDVHLNLMQNLAIPHAQIGTIIFPYVAISSSTIRQRLREGRSVLYMVPKAVNDLLCGKNFYGCKDNKLD